MNNNYLMHRSHKYAKKVWKNGRWRYYYDNDSKPDRGFSIKKMQRGTMENNIGITSVENSLQKKNKIYYVSGNANEPLWSSDNHVDQDVYEHADARLFYKNEPVKDIAKRNYEEFKKASSNAIKKGKDFVESLMSKIENLRKKG